MAANKYCEKKVYRFLKSVVMACCAALLVLFGCGEQENADLENDPLGDLKVLPADKGGEHIPHVLDAGLSYGHYLYLPDGYRHDGPEYPLIVFLHGGGEKGNSQDSAAHLSRILLHGPPKLIKENRWKPPFPMIVASPQLHDIDWNAEKLHTFIKSLLNEYAVNRNRIYITGLSLGANGVFSYVSAYGNASYAAAIVPIAGWGDPSTAAAFSNTPVWAFHNEEDNRISANSSIRMIEEINKVNPADSARVTIFPVPGHNAWEKPYAGKGMGTESADYDAYQETIYEWFIRHSR